MKVFAMAFIIALLLSAIALFQFTSLASANPMDGTPVPPAYQMPNEDPPEVTVQSPLNNTSSENDVWLNFTVHEPYTWFKPDVVCYINNVTYQIDEDQAIVLNATPSEEGVPATKQTKQFSVVLNGLPEGQHNLQINVSAESEYLPYPTHYFWLKVRYYPLDTSQTIVFTVQNSSPEDGLSVDPNFSLYTGLTLLIIVIATFAGLLVYFKKRKR
jgi:hypothetical protein